MIRVLGLGIVLLFVMLVGPAGAQEGTPALPDSFEIAPGVTADSVTFVEGQENPLLYRLHFAPGVVYPVEPGSNLELVLMEAGSLTMTLNASITVGQVGTTDTAGESTPSGTEVTLTAGQYFVLQPGVSGEVRNDGEEPATVSIAGIAPAGVIIPEATPAG